MADFFEELGKKISDAASEIGKTAEDALEIQKLKSDIRSMKRANDRDMLHLGRMVYDKFQKGEVDDTDYISLCEETEKREQEMERLEEEIARSRRCARNQWFYVKRGSVERYEGTVRKEKQRSSERVGKRKESFGVRGSGFSFFWG